MAGRPRKSPKALKDKRVDIRLTQREYERAEELARRHSSSMAELARRAFYLLEIQPRLLESTVGVMRLRRGPWRESRAGKTLTVHLSRRDFFDATELASSVGICEVPTLLRVALYEVCAGRLRYGVGPLLDGPHVEYYPRERPSMTIVGGGRMPRRLDWSPLLDGYVETPVLGPCDDASGAPDDDVPSGRGVLVRDDHRRRRQHRAPHRP